MKLSINRALALIALVACAFVPAAHAESTPAPAERAATSHSLGAVATGAAVISTTQHAAAEYGAAEQSVALRQSDGAASYVRTDTIVGAGPLLVHRYLSRAAHARLAIAVNVGVSPAPVWAAAHNHWLVRRLEAAGLPGRVESGLRFAYAMQF